MARVETAQQELDIKELKEVVEFVLSLGNAIGKSLSDGKPDFFDLLYFLDVFASAYQAFNGIGSAFKEFKDLDEFERDELYELVQENFTVDSTEIDELINKCICTSMSLMDVVKAFTDFSFEAEPGSHSDA